MGFLSYRISLVMPQLKRNLSHIVWVEIMKQGNNKVTMNKEELKPLKKKFKLLFDFIIRFRKLISWESPFWPSR